MELVPNYRPALFDFPRQVEPKPPLKYLSESAQATTAQEGGATNAPCAGAPEEAIASARLLVKVFYLQISLNKIKELLLNCSFNRINLNGQLSYTKKITVSQIFLAEPTLNQALFLIIQLIVKNFSRM